MKKLQREDPIRKLASRFSEVYEVRPDVAYMILRDIMFWVKHWENSEIHFSHRYSKVGDWLHQKYDIPFRGHAISRWYKKISSSIE